MSIHQFLSMLRELCCITQLLLCLDDWTLIWKTTNRSMSSTRTLLKAFDSIPRERLLNKLEHLGVRGDILNWIRSFLTGRTQCVRVEGFTLKWMEVVSGIPQGSVLGPLLFVVFINDLPDDMKYSICRTFADDCKLYGLVGNENLNKLQIDLRELERWSLKWQLPFNVKKCKVLHFGKNNPEREYVLYDHILETSDQQKDLGILVDNKLKFHSHAAAAAKKANQVLGVIKKSYTTRDTYTIKTLYTAMVRPHLEYGNVVWGPNYQGDIKMLEKFQRRATKMVTAIKDLPYVKRHTELKLPSLVYLRRRGDMIIMYKIMNRLVKINDA